MRMYNKYENAGEYKTLTWIMDHHDCIKFCLITCRLLKLQLDIDPFWLRRMTALVKLQNIGYKMLLAKLILKRGNVKETSNPKNVFP